MHDSFRVIAGATFLTLLATGLGAAEPRRPNIVLVLCDDLGYADVGFNGSKDIFTPALDSLANDGTICTSGYVVHPFCGPSRMGLLAGRYPHSFGAPYNLPPTGKAIERYADEGIPVSETLISTVLQSAGYHTGAIGKWHLGFSPQYHPNVRGFDDYYGFLGGGHMYFPEKYGPIYERQSQRSSGPFNEYIIPLEHNGEQVRETEYMTDALSREAVRFVSDAAKKDAPFFLYLAYNAPHTPLEAKEEDLALFANIEDEKRRTYAAMVYAVDRGIGRLTNALKETDQFDNTLIIFLSDNGGKIGSGADNGPLRQGKGSVCEGGIRVPMFFHWPGQIPSNTRYDHPVSAIDFYPMFAALAGASVPADQPLDGTNIWPAITGGRAPQDGKHLFALRHFRGFSNVGVRRDEWKLSKRGPKSPWNLFNMNDDIGESNDLSDAHPDVVRSMISAAEHWSRSHVQPRWFDNENAASYWTEHDMPNYDKTFSNK